MWKRISAALVAAFLLSAPVQAQECAPLGTVKEALNSNRIAYDVLNAPRTYKLLELLADQLPPGGPWTLALLALADNGALFVLLGRDETVCARVNLTDGNDPEKAHQAAKMILQRIFGWAI